MPRFACGRSLNAACAVRARENVPTSAPPPTERARLERLGRAALGLGLGLAAAACTSATTRVALQGDLPSLKAAIADADGQGHLDSGPVQELAEAVLTRELSSMRGPNEQFPRIDPCVKRMRSVLEDVAAGSREFAAP